MPAGPAGAARTTPPAPARNSAEKLRDFQGLAGIYRNATGPLPATLPKHSRFDTTYTWESEYSWRLGEYQR